MFSYQDFMTEAEKDVAKAVGMAITAHKDSDDYKTAKDADLYDKQKNKTIYEYIHMMFTLTGTPIEDFTASNNKIASNFFRRLNTQRATYLLGNGVSFAENEGLKDKLGKGFDTKLKKLAYNALIHGTSFGFWNVKGLHVFKLTEFAPLWDEETGELRAGVRFWQIDDHKPMNAVLYEEDGFTKYRSNIKNGAFAEIQPKRAYQITVRTSVADGEEVIGEDNYGSLPIIPMWGSELKQSTLIGMQESIDSFDLIRSGFANDLSDCAMIYWILSGAGGMSNAEINEFRDRLKLLHIAAVDTDNSQATPYTQEIPYNARQVYLSEIRSGIYEDFGGLDVHAVAAGATNDHIEAAYQPLDEQADDLEYQVIEFMDHLLALLGEEDTPIFKRNRISNQTEQTEMVLAAAEYLDEETVLKKLPFITVDEVADILAKKAEEEQNRYSDEELDARLTQLEEGQNNGQNQGVQGQQNGEVNG